jgi:hypothetical protein
MSQFQLRRLFLDMVRFDKADVSAAFEPRNLYFLIDPPFSHRAAYLLPL